MAALHKIRIATLDKSKAYLQAGYLQRDIYMRPPTGFKSKPGEIWKILKPAYGLVESSGLWQTTIEQWMIDTYGLDTVPSLPQLFIYRSKQEPPRLVIAKVIDDLRVAKYAFNEIRQVVPKLLSRSPASISSANYLAFSDAAQV